MLGGSFLAQFSALFHRFTHAHAVVIERACAVPTPPRPNKLVNVVINYPVLILGVVFIDCMYSEMLPSKAIT